MAERAAHQLDRVLPPAPPDLPVFERDPRAEAVQSALFLSAECRVAWWGRDGGAVAPDRATAGGGVHKRRLIWPILNPVAASGPPLPVMGLTHYPASGLVDKRSLNRGEFSADVNIMNSLK